MSLRCGKRRRRGRRNSSRSFPLELVSSCKCAESLADLRMQNSTESNVAVEESNPIKRLLWPRYSPLDADLLGQQGFWICLFVALLSLVGGVMQGHWITGFIAFSFFFLGGVGVREHSFVAALLIAPAYVLNIVVVALTGHLPVSCPLSPPYCCWRIFVGHG